ncbi:MAG TPA: thiamine phosphate synthase, partial [Paenibacillus sp.]
MRHLDAEAIRRAMQVYLVMGSVNTTRDPVEVLRQAIAGGITLFQFREKGTGALVGEARITLAMRLRELCSQHGIPFIVNDDVELAVAVEADGMHVGQDDADAALVRARIGEGRMLGVSAHSALEA